MQMNKLVNKSKTIEFLVKHQFQLNLNFKVKYLSLYLNRMLLAVQVHITKHLQTTNKTSYQNSNLNFQIRCKCKATSNLGNLRHITLLKITQWIFQLFLIVRVQKRIKRLRLKHLLRELYLIMVDVQSVHLNHLVNIMEVLMNWMLICRYNNLSHPLDHKVDHHYHYHQAKSSQMQY